MLSIFQLDGSSYSMTIQVSQVCCRYLYSYLKELSQDLHAWRSLVMYSPSFLCSFIFLWTLSFCKIFCWSFHFCSLFDTLLIFLVTDSTTDWEDWNKTILWIPLAVNFLFINFATTARWLNLARSLQHKYYWLAYLLVLPYLVCVIW